MHLKKIDYLRRFRKKCKEINPDLICVFLIDVVRLTVIGLRGMSYHILASERADPSQFTPKKTKQYNRALNNCTAVVYQLEEAAKYYNINPGIIQEVIPNPAIVRNISAIKSKKGSDELFIFGAGRLTRQKRFDLLIDAFDIVHNTYPEYRLKIYGDGIERKALEDKVVGMGLGKYIDFMGDVKDIFQDVNDKSIFVLTSDFEGIPNVITEALINKVPCISTNCSPGGARLLLNDGECGDIVECGDHKGIAKSIIKYIENPSYAKEKSVVGSEHLKKFSPNVIEQDWLNLFERIFQNE